MISAIMANGIDPAINDLRSGGSDNYDIKDRGDSIDPRMVTSWVYAWHGQLGM